MVAVQVLHGVSRKSAKCEVIDVYYNIITEATGTYICLHKSECCFQKSRQTVAPRIPLSIVPISDLLDKNSKDDAKSVFAVRPECGWVISGVEDSGSGKRAGGAGGRSSATLLEGAAARQLRR